MGGPCFSIARSTISIALSTPAQKPLGLAKYSKLMKRNAVLIVIEKFYFSALSDEQSYQ